MRIISLKIIESEGWQCCQQEEETVTKTQITFSFSCRKSKKRPAVDTAEDAAAAAAAEAGLTEQEEEGEYDISFHILCFHGKFLPPILRFVVTLVVIAPCMSSCARQMQLRRSK